MQALVCAAAELFAERGPSATSVRDVAERAGVNHGLVHRHFGSKDELVRAVLDGLAADLAQELAAPSGGEGVVHGDPAVAEPAAMLWGAFELVLRKPEYWQVLARALLDGLDSSDLQTQYPVVTRLVDALEAARERGQLDEGVNPRMLAAGCVAAGLGWAVFERYVLRATEQAMPVDEARRELGRTVRAIERSLLRGGPGKAARSAG